MPVPLVPAVVLALATFSVHMGHEARAYALALLFVVLAGFLAYLGADAIAQDRSRALVYALAAGFSGGAALWTNYLALFPVLGIVLWFCLRVWSVSRRLAAVPIVVIGLVSIPLLVLLSVQLGARPLQEAGRLMWLDQILLLVWMNLSDFHTSMIPSRFLQYATWGAVLLLMLYGLVRYVMRRRCGESRLLLLLLALAVAPTAGVALLNLVFDKHLSALRYVGLALPGLAAAASYGPASLIERRRTLGTALVVLLLVMQLTGVNWGFERTFGQGDTNVRSTVRAIESLAPSSLVVVIGAGAGRGHPGSVIYELHPMTVMAVLYGWGFSDVDDLALQVAAYENVCLVRSMESASLDAEHAFLDHLKAGGYAEVFRAGTAVCLQREP